MRYSCLALVLGLVACDVEVEPFCGDGHIDLGEQCDDGGGISGDGCSSVCVVETRCGDARVDAGEQCDDGNTTAADGCSSTCTSETCGNSIVDAGEQCDDGNFMPSDGCSTTCDTEQQYTIAASWTIRNVAGTPQAICSGVYTTAAVVSQPLDDAGNPVGNAIIDLFDCTAGTGTTGPLYEGHYDVWISIQNGNGTQVYATSVKARLELTQNLTLNASIYTDGGYFGFAWLLRGSVSNNVLTCAQAGADSVELIATVTGGSTAFTDIYDCTDGSGVTAALAAGSYTVSISALNVANASIGTAPALVNQVIQAPNRVTNLGSVTIPITGL